MTRATPNVILPVTDPIAIHELATRGVAEVDPSQAALEEALMSGQRLRAYMGIDPTGPDVHIGHASQLIRMERLRQLGHDVVLLIGDRTAQIGDPTDRSATRTQLTGRQVKQNERTYLAQIGKILDLDNSWNPVTVRHNSEWLDKMRIGEILSLMAEFTANQVLDRHEFEKRMRGDGNDLWYAETMYPLLQAMDSVALETDIELGGIDQIFNMRMGSKLLKRRSGKQKYVIGGELLVDPDGTKMGKTQGNMVTLNDPPLSVYQKVMRWGDRITPTALTLCTTMPMDQIAEIRRDLESGALSGQDGKKLLARAIITEIDGQEAAQRGEAQYRQLVERSEPLDPAIFDFATVRARPGEDIVGLLVRSKLVPSRNEARRLLGQGGIYVNEEPINAEWAVPADQSSLLLRRGKPNLDNYRRVEVRRPRSRT